MKRSKRNPKCKDELKCWKMLVRYGFIDKTAPVECLSRKCTKKRPVQEAA
jgi:hypothetical protein